MITSKLETKLGLIYSNSSVKHPESRLRKLANKATKDVVNNIFPDNICPNFFNQYKSAENNKKVKIFENQKIGLYYALPFGNSTLFFVISDVIVKPESYGIEAGYVREGIFNGNIVRKRMHEEFGIYWSLCNIRS